MGFRDTLRRLARAPHLGSPLDEAELREAARSPWLWSADDRACAASIGLAVEEPRPGDVLLATHTQARTALWHYRPRNAGPTPLGLEAASVESETWWLAVRTAEFLPWPTKLLARPHGGLTRLASTDGDQRDHADGASGGLAMLLAGISYLIDRPVPADLAALASVNGRGEVGTVSGVRHKAELIGQVARGVSRLLVHPDQVLEAQGGAPGLSVLPVSGVRHAIEHAWPGERTQRGPFGPDRDAVFDDTLEIVLERQDALVG